MRTAWFSEHSITLQTVPVSGSCCSFSLVTELSKLAVTSMLSILFMSGFNLYGKEEGENALTLQHGLFQKLSLSHVKLYCTVISHTRSFLQKMLDLA